jgi:hypothetical protein
VKIFKKLVFIYNLNWESDFIEFIFINFRL